MFCCCRLFSRVKLLKSLLRTPRTEYNWIWLYCPFKDVILHTTTYIIHNTLIPSKCLYPKPFRTDYTNGCSTCVSFHLSLCLSAPPSRCRPFSPLSPGYLYLCSLFVRCQFILFHQGYQRFFLCSSLLMHPVFPGFDLFYPSWPWACLTSCTFAPLLWITDLCVTSPWSCLPSCTFALLLWIINPCLPWSVVCLSLLL